MIQTYRQLPPCVDSTGHHFALAPHRPDPYCDRCGYVSDGSTGVAGASGVNNDRGFSYETSR